MTSTILRRLILVLVLGLVVASCGEDNKVGSGVDLSVSDKANERLGETTTTTAAAAADDKADGGSLGVGETTTTTAAVAATTTTTAPPEKAAISITINSDTSGTTQFEPSAARVFKGSLIEWKNNDNVPRSVEFDDGSLNSGPIAPGAIYKFRADKVGQFNYTDGTRPYAVGTLEVIAQ